MEPECLSLVGWECAPFIERRSVEQSASLREKVGFVTVGESKDVRRDSILEGVMLRVAGVQTLHDCLQAPATC